VTGSHVSQPPMPLYVSACAVTRIAITMSVIRIATTYAVIRIATTYAVVHIATTYAVIRIATRYDRRHAEPVEERAPFDRLRVTGRNCYAGRGKWEERAYD
jgi:cbb3-type cytochrome oxidase cytochrome c subunit